MKNFFPKILIFVCFSYLSIGFVDAQVSTENQILRDVNSDVIFRNEAIINQIGNNNSSNILQVKSSEQNGNFTELIQNGNFNIVLIEQKGGNNQNNISQTGLNNNYELRLVGENNNIFVVQNGNDNKVVQDLINSNLNNIKVIQQGNSNEVIQYQEATLSVPIQIIQRGEGLQVIVRNGGVSN